MASGLRTMVKADGLRFGPLGRRCVHICVDAQRLFAEPTDWHTPWLARVLPNMERLAAAHPHETIFTRFIPARSAFTCEGTWRRYYERWPSMTIEALGSEMIELLTPLVAHVPPAHVINKRVYSPWLASP